MISIQEISRFCVIFRIKILVFCAQVSVVNQTLPAIFAIES